MKNEVQEDALRYMEEEDVDFTVVNYAKSVPENHGKYGH